MASILLPRTCLKMILRCHQGHYERNIKPLLMHSNPSFCTRAISDVNDLDTGELNLSGSTIPAKMGTSDVFGTLRVPLERGLNIMQKKKRSNVKASNSLQTFKRPHTMSQDNSDEFGNLCNDNPIWYSPLNEEEEDADFGEGIKSEYVLERKYKTANAYLKEMKLLVKEKKLKEALELFPHMKEHTVFPIHANYTFMIGACGRAGYTDMAFKLLKQMTSREFRPTAATLTGLFNSCAEGPFPKDCLEKAIHLREKIKLKNWPLAPPTYHAMIKCFGKCGDIETAFELVDEMKIAGFPVTTQTYNFLLMSCISDKAAGFTHSVEVWRKLLSRKLQPNIYAFNLMLRAVRDCGIGPEEISSLLLQHWSSYRKRPYGLNNEKETVNRGLLKLPGEKALALEAGSGIDKQIKEVVISGEMSGNSLKKYETPAEKGPIQKVESLSDSPLNILAKRPSDGPMIVDLSTVKNSASRLALFGNADGFLNMMSSFHVKPNIKTFTLILESQKSDNATENYLLALMDKYNVIPDVDFFNLVIKKRKFRNDHFSARNVLHLINKYNLNPDIVTFGVLALECHGSKNGLQLLQNMNQLRIHPNVEIMGALIHMACADWNLPYLQTLLTILNTEEIKLNEKIKSTVEKSLHIIRKNIIETEQGKQWDKQQPFEDVRLQYQKFTDFYTRFLDNIGEMENEHPWDQYKVEIIYDRIKKNERKQK